MTLNVGNKVQVTDNYLRTLRNPDKTVTGVRGKSGTITRISGQFLEVTPLEPDAEFWITPQLFLRQELVLLEEAHPLQKEFTKS